MRIWRPSLSISAHCPQSGTSSPSPRFPVCSQNLIKRKINNLREIARTLRSNVKRLALTFWQEEFTFCSDRPNSLILKMERILENHTRSGLDRGCRHMPKV